MTVQTIASREVAVVRVRDGAPEGLDLLVTGPSATVSDMAVEAESSILVITIVTIGLIFALLLGLVLFGDWPKALTLIGAAIIVATGSFNLWRESQLRRRAVAQAKMRRT